MSYLEKNWSVAIICSREAADVLKHCVLAALEACVGRPANIDILVNGNEDLAYRAKELLSTGAIAAGSASICVWFIPLGDKANAWNEYVHRIWPEGTDVFFLDGYARAKPDAFENLSRSLNSKSFALGATGVPTSGRSAEKLRNQMLNEGGLHGNMHVIRSNALAEIRARGVRLPLGLYRTDSLIGAFLMFGLDPKKNTWSPARVVVDASATWEIPELTKIGLLSFRAQVKRIVRQAQGHLENRAVRQHLAVENRSPELLPETNKELVNQWVRSHLYDAFRAFLKHPLSIYARYRIQAKNDWTSPARNAVLIASSGETWYMGKQSCTVSSDDT